MTQHAHHPRHAPPPPLVGSHLTPALRTRLLAAAADARTAALSSVGAEAGTSGRGVYVGTAGLALADLHVARRLVAATEAGRAAAAGAGLPPAPSLAAAALAAARSAARLPPGSWRSSTPLTPATLLEGRLGPYVVAGGAAAAAAAAVSSQPAFGPGDPGFEEWVGAVAGAATAADAGLPPGECEVLYGRAGVLAALVCAAGGVPGAAPRLEPAARALATSIIAAGRAAAAARAASTGGEAWGLGPWAWHGSLYLGAAHGGVGVLATLLDARRVFSGVSGGGGGGEGGARFWGEDLPSAVADGVAGLLAHGLHPSGNLKSSAGSGDDRLVHWCHGAPGLVLLLQGAGDLRLPPAAAAAAASALRDAADVVWHRGWLTTKGVGLCHGWAGNGYALLAAGQGVAGGSLARPLAWAAAVADRWTEAWRRADRPASLYEGLAGVYTFLVDVALWAEEGDGRGCVGMPGFLLGGGGQV